MTQITCYCIVAGVRNYVEVGTAEHTHLILVCVMEPQCTRDIIQKSLDSTDNRLTFTFHDFIVLFRSSPSNDLLLSYLFHGCDFFHGFPLNLVIIFLPFASRLAILGLQAAGTQYFEPMTTVWYRRVSTGYAAAMMPTTQKTD